MEFTHNKNPRKNFTSITVVLVLHLIIGYAVVSGLGKRMIEVIKKPVETKIVEEVKPPPPPDMPPPPPPPKMVAPPPPFIPPPEVQVSQPAPAPVISQTTAAAPATNQLPSPRPAPAAAPVASAPAAKPVHIPAVVDSSKCEKPEYPRNSLRNEETGTVYLAFLIGVDGRVIDSRIEKSSGFKDLDKAAKNGLSLCKFKPGTTDGKPEQSWAKMEYVWKLE